MTRRRRRRHPVARRHHLRLQHRRSPSGHTSDVAITSSDRAIVCRVLIVPTVNAGWLAGDTMPPITRTLPAFSVIARGCHDEDVRTSAACTAPQRIGPPRLEHRARATGSAPGCCAIPVRDRPGSPRSRRRSPAPLGPIALRLTKFTPGATPRAHSGTPR
jgi:hypothetical protein